MGLELTDLDLSKPQQLGRGFLVRGWSRLTCEFHLKFDRGSCFCWCFAGSKIPQIPSTSQEPPAHSCLKIGDCGLARAEGSLVYECRTWTEAVSPMSRIGIRCHHCRWFSPGSNGGWIVEFRENGRTKWNWIGECPANHVWLWDELLRWEAPFLLIRTWHNHIMESLVGGKWRSVPAKKNFLT